MKGSLSRFIGFQWIQVFAKIVGCVCISLVSMPSWSSTDFGIKAGYQVYDNQLSSPSSLGAGALFTTSLPFSESLFIEGGVTYLGEAQEKNQNTGEFVLAELSALYKYPTLADQHLFLKAGISPWVGFVTANDGQQFFDKGVSPSLGAGYQFQITNALQSRLEYQYFYNLGSDNIGQTDSHLFTLGLLWTQDQSIAEEAVEKEYKNQALNSLPNENDDHHNRYLGQLQGKVLFEVGSSWVWLPRGESALSKVGDLATNPDCRILHVQLKGFADNTGDSAINQALSEKRAASTAAYFIRHFNIPESLISFSAYGNQRFSALEAPTHNAYERRVDFDVKYECAGVD